MGLNVKHYYVLLTRFYRSHGSVTCVLLDFLTNCFIYSHLIFQLFFHFLFEVDSSICHLQDRLLRNVSGGIFYILSNEPQPHELRPIASSRMLQHFSESTCNVASSMVVKMVTSPTYLSNVSILISVSLSSNSRGILIFVGMISNDPFFKVALHFSSVCRSSFRFSLKNYAICVKESLQIVADMP